MVGPRALISPHVTIPCNQLLQKVGTHKAQNTCSDDSDTTRAILVNVYSEQLDRGTVDHSDESQGDHT